METAQDLLNEIERETKNEIDIKDFVLSRFYPEEYKRIQTDKNITKCLKELK